jgi:hypothetical protein
VETTSRAFSKFEPKGRRLGAFFDIEKGVAQALGAAVICVYK